MIACRPTSLNAICCALCRVVVAIGIAETTRSGIGHRPFERLHPAHRSAGDREQPLDPEMSRSAFFCNRTMSPMVITGNAIAYGQPVAGLIEAGPVVPRQPPSTFEQMTK